MIVFQWLITMPNFIPFSSTSSQHGTAKVDIPIYGAGFHMRLHMLGRSIVRFPPL